MLIEEAHAQAAEAGRALEKASDKLLADPSYLGVLCVVLGILLIVAGFIVRHLHNKNEAKDERYVALLERVVIVAEAGKDAAEGNAEAARGLTSAVNALTKAVETLSRETEGEARETRHGLAAVMAGVNGIARRLRATPEADAG